LWGKFIIVFDESAPRIGKSGGVAHFGFRLVDANDIDRAADLTSDRDTRRLRALAEEVRSA